MSAREEASEKTFQGQVMAERQTSGTQDDDLIRNKISKHERETEEVKEAAHEEGLETDEDRKEARENSEIEQSWRCSDERNDTSPAESENDQGIQVDSERILSTELGSENELTDAQEHKEKIRVIQATACLKMQSLWKGHWTRQQYCRSSPRFQVVRLENIWLSDIPSWAVHYICNLDTTFRISLTVWNLSTSNRVFRWKSNPVDTKLLVSATKKVPANNKQKSDNPNISVILPGIDEDCVVSIGVEVKRRLVLDASLVDLEVFKDTFLISKEKKMTVAAVNKCKIGKTSSRKISPSEGIENCKFDFTIRSAAHGYCGWLWASDALSHNDNQTSSTGTPRGRRNRYSGISSPTTATGSRILSKSDISKPAEAAPWFLGIFGACMSAPTHPIPVLRKVKPDDPIESVNLLNETDVQGGAKEVDGKLYFARDVDLKNSKCPPPPEMISASRMAPPVQLKQRWDWFPFWGALFDGCLNLYHHYGSLEPAFVIPVKDVNIIPFLFERSDVSEFKIEAKPPSTTPIFLEGQSKYPFREATSLTFVAEGRAHAISWVTKLKASALRDCPPRWRLMQVDN